MHTFHHMPPKPLPAAQLLPPEPAPSSPSPPQPQAKVTLEAAYDREQAFVDELKKMPIAIHTAEANEQHYEVPTEYYLHCLGVSGHCTAWG